MDRLPRDMLYRIIDRLPIKSLASFRCANKEFYGDPVIESRISKFIEEPKLVLLDKFPVRNSLDVTALFELHAEANILKVSSPDAMPIRFLGSCNGLMCFYGDNRGDLLLVNPFLKEVLLVSTSYAGLDSEDQLPILGGSYSAGFGLDRVSGSYKIVAITKRTALVYNFSTRRLPQHQYRGQMVSFNVAKEEFSALPCRPFADSLFDLENQLGLGYSDAEGHIHILELNIHSKEWTTGYEIDSRILYPPGYDWEDIVSGYVILGIWNQRIVLRDCYSYYLYDPQRQAEFMDWDYREQPDYCIRGSLVSLSRFNS